MTDYKAFGREVLILTGDVWFIAHLGIIKSPEGIVVAMWTDRDGGVIIPIGDEDRLEMLPNDL